MTTLRYIFTAYGTEYLERHPHLPLTPQGHPRHLRCRTGAYGYSLYTCQNCGQQHRVYHACGNRHCPQCQHQKAQQWLHHQLHKQLPGPYFLITFTVPETLRPFCRSHPTLAYQAMFKASSEALKRLANDARFIGTNLPGFTGILHTWGRQLQYHPHIHYIVPGGGLSKDRAAWFPHEPTSMSLSKPSRLSTALSSKKRCATWPARTDRPTGLAHPLECA